MSVIPGKGLSVQRFGEVTCYEFAILRGSSQNCGVSVHLLRVAFPWIVGLTVPYRLAENLALPLGLFQNFSPQRTAVAPQTPFSGSSSRTHSGFLPELQPFLLDWKSCEEMWISHPLGRSSWQSIQSLWFLFSSVPLCLLFRIFSWADHCYLQVG